MIFVVYHADAHHTCKPVSIYQQIWPKFLECAEQRGYLVTQMTTMDGRQYAKHVRRFDVDATKPMYSREVCWLEMLKELPEHEQLVLLEPDFQIRKAIPPLRPGNDFLLLDRRGDTYMPGFRIARQTAIPFYESVLKNFTEQFDWLGDCVALHKTLGAKYPRPGPPCPERWMHLKIEVRDSRHYGHDGHKPDAIMWHWKGKDTVRWLK